MIVPFWSWNLSDTTHVRSHTKFQLIWAINTAFTRGGHNVPPPSLKCVAGTPSLLGLKNVCALILPFQINQNIVVKLRQGSGKDWQGMAVKAKGLKA